MTHYTDDSLLFRKETAALLGTKPHTLEVWASSGRYKLPYVKVGRLVRYRYKDVLEFIQRNTRHHSASESQGGNNA
ncbi:MAG: helix-turn-helix domain-containing protein [Alphaproteobacteria bacterium]|nr:helix-turn-helix domain-containing protein [Alphaproteobacteria bacterium]